MTLVNLFFVKHVHVCMGPSHLKGRLCWIYIYASDWKSTAVSYLVNLKSSFTYVWVSGIIFT